MKQWKQLLGGTLLSLAMGSAFAATPFENDVGVAIDRGLDSLDARNAFNNPSSAGEAAGLVALALLEKRASGDPTDPPQGYDGANATDQARMRNIIAYILDRVNETSFYAYRDGNYLMALSEYLLTGGPDKGEVAEIPDTADYVDLVTAINTLVDRSLAAQRQAPVYPNAIDQGYWCYSNAGCEDSSTTQFVVAGLGSAKTAYSDPAYSDPARVASINTALALARQAYQLNALAGADSNSGCTDIGDADELGHGYRAQSYAPSLQQTASGLWIQILGGAGLNDATVQGYTRWIRNRYRWDNLGNFGNSWESSSYWYYLWSSFKGMEFLRNAGVAPAPGNLGTDEYGTLPAADAPACPNREVHRDPAADTRVASFGAGGAGFYNEESQSQYYDYAYQILTHQCAQGLFNAGEFECNGAPSRWNDYSRDAYALLVLLRATGGACVDTDGDGVCDDDDNCPQTPNADQADADGDGVGDVCDNCPNNANPNQEDTDADGIGDACEGPVGLQCDIDGDQDVDRDDIGLITAARNTPAAPGDPRDNDGNGVINVLDARQCVLLCTLPRCASPDPI